MSIKLSLAPESARQLAALRAGLNRAAAAAGGEGLRDAFVRGLAQLGRFVAANIEVDTGRTKNSVFEHVSQRRGEIVAMLGTNVIYSPYVRDAGHREQFFSYAARVEAPRVVDQLGNSVIATIEGEIR